MQYILVEEIVRLSDARLWEQAKLEWSLVSTVKVDEPHRCLCDHYPIHNLCTIRNSVNKNIAVVGNCCVKKFMGLRPDKLLASVKKIRADISKSVCPDMVTFAAQKGWINEWERSFYTDIWRKRELTDKQRSIKVGINSKILCSWDVL